MELYLCLLSYFKKMMTFVHSGSIEEDYTNDGES